MLNIDEVLPFSILKCTPNKLITMSHVGLAVPVLSALKFWTCYRDCLQYHKVILDWITIKSVVSHMVIQDCIINLYIKKTGTKFSYGLHYQVWWLIFFYYFFQISVGSTNVRIGSTIFGARDYSAKAQATNNDKTKDQNPSSSAQTKENSEKDNVASVSDDLNELKIEAKWPMTLYYLMNI